MTAMKRTRSALGAALAVTLLAGPAAVDAQEKIHKIGYLAENSMVNAPPNLTSAFRQRLRDLGYVEGRNIVIEYREAQGQLERLPALAAELVALKVDVLVAPPTRAALAARQATKTIPIVFFGSSDPVTSGLVVSLAKPGGNVTGLTGSSPQMVGKCLELLTQTVPRANRIAVLWQPGAAGERTERDTLTEARAAAQALGVRLQLVEARRATDLDRALVVWTTAMLVSERKRLVELADKHRLPAVYTSSSVVDAGGLMAYGHSQEDLNRRAATYVDKLLKGAKPADLPVEQPTKFDLIVNLKAARALGLTVPPLVLGRAERIIE
jgi:putative ABC transport system substrate-binding protein